MKEIWKDIEGYEGHYQVSNLGRVKSLEREESYLRQGTLCTRRRKAMIMAIPKDKDGYSLINLTREGLRKTYRLHRIVAKAFIPGYNEHVNHINGIKSDNRVENLEWCTNQENIKHAINTGLTSRIGTDNPRAKLTEEDVIIIKKLLKLNLYKHSTVAELFGVNKAQISCIKRGKTWSHVNG